MSKTYDGLPCRHCGGTTRYAANRNCVPCSLARNRAYNKTPKGRERSRRAERRRPKRNDYKRAQRYGLTIEEVEAMRENQKDLCAICNSAPAECVDHNHKTGLVRGMLCMHCNTGLGKFRDNPALLKKAAEYLSKDLAY